MATYRNGINNRRMSGFGFGSPVGFGVDVQVYKVYLALVVH